jgi:hypothetical protein
MARNRVIALAGGSPVVAEQGAAGEAGIYPGHLLVLSGGTLVRHNVAGGFAALNFALERSELGRDIDVVYAVGDRVKVGGFHQGQVVHALVPSGTAVVQGDLLQSNGLGALIPWVGGTQALALAIDDADLTTSPTLGALGLQRVKAELI